MKLFTERLPVRNKLETETAQIDFPTENENNGQKLGRRKVKVKNSEKGEKKTTDNKMKTNNVARRVGTPRKNRLSASFPSVPYVAHRTIPLSPQVSYAYDPVDLERFPCRKQILTTQTFQL